MTNDDFERRSRALFQCKKEMAEAMKPILDKHDVSDVDFLSLLAYMVGETIALLDKDTVSPMIAMAQVQMNIELGNQSMIRNLTVPPGTKRN